jgi:hypothetical protein
MSGVVDQCGEATLRSYGGLPQLGNRDYGLELESPARGLCVIVLGLQRDTFCGRPLPLELGSFAPGCWLLTDIDRLRISRKDGSTERLPLRIPRTTAGLELDLYAQGAVLAHLGHRKRGPGMHATNGLAIHVRP